MSAGENGRVATIVVNGLFLDHARTGTGVYTREVLSRLLAGRAEWGERYVVVGHPEHRRLFAVPGAYVRCRALGQRHSATVEKVAWEQLALPLAAARLGADLLYAPYFSLPLVSSAPAVVTVHDVIPLLLPEYAQSVGLKAYFKLVSAATRRASAIVTDSRHSAEDIARVLDVPRERIHVVYLGVDERYGRSVGLDVVRELYRRLRLPERFILYLGGVDPRKNVGVLLRAMRLLVQERRAILPLVVVAPRGGRFADPRDEARQLGLQDSVIFLDWIAEEDKPALYASSTAFAYPSRYEGFGLPPLEAMKSGAPTICSTSASLPEVVGDAALLVDPDDVPGWAAALERLSTDAALRRDLAERGRAHAAAFTWHRTVGGLSDVFHRVLQG